MANKAAGNITVVYNSFSMTPYLTDTSLEMIVNAIDTTNLASTGGEQIPGVTDYRVPVSGDWAKALDDVLAPDAISPPTTLRTLVVTVGPGGSVATYTFTNKAFVGQYSFKPDNPKGKLTWSGQLEISGAAVRS